MRDTQGVRLGVANSLTADTLVFLHFSALLSLVALSHSHTEKHVVLGAPAEVYERLQRLEERVIDLEKVAAVAELLRIHRGKGVDALLAELDGTAPPPPPHAAPRHAIPAPAPIPLPPAAAHKAPQDDRKRSAAALSLSHAAPAASVAPAVRAPAAPEDPRELEARMAQLKEALLRKQLEKRQKQHQQG